MKYTYENNESKKNDIKKANVWHVVKNCSLVVGGTAVYGSAISFLLTIVGAPIVIAASLLTVAAVMGGTYLVSSYEETKYLAKAEEVDKVVENLAYSAIELNNNEKQNLEIESEVKSSSKSVKSKENSSSETLEK